MAKPHWVSRAAGCCRAASLELLYYLSPVVIPDGIIYKHLQRRERELFLPSRTSSFMASAERFQNQIKNVSV